MDAGGDRSRRSLLLLCLASLGWAVSFGLGAPLASLWLEAGGHSAGIIGLNTSFYYLGVALAAPLVPWLMRRANRACVVTGMTLDAATTALFPWCDWVPLWHVLRFAGGVGTALSLIPMETLVNHNAPGDRRARDFGLYAFCVALGVGIGPVLGLPLYPVAPRLAFALGGLVTLLAVGLAWCAVPASAPCQSDDSGRGELAWEREKKPLPPSSPPRSGEGGAAFSPSPFRGGGRGEGCLRRLWRDGLFGLGTAWVQGFLEAGTITFLSIYLLSLGYNSAATSGLMGTLFAGVVAAQLPLAWLADRLGRRRVLLACHTLVLAGLACLPWSSNPAPLAGWLFLLGACCGALYPLGLALLGERIPPGGLARANAWYLASNCAGSLSGPVLIGLAIDAFGLRAQFAAGAVAVLLVLAISRPGPRPIHSATGAKDEARRAA